MPVYKDKKRDTWYIAINYIDPLTNKYKKKFKRGFSSKKEAQLAEAKLLQENTFKSDSTTFRVILDMYLNHTEASPTTRHMKTTWISNYFQYIDAPIERITKPILVEWRNNLNKTNLATRTKNRGMQYVKGVFTFYSDLYGGTDNGKILKSFKLQKEDKEEMDIWTPEEFDQFIEYVELPVYKAFYTFLFWTGCRRGEALAICKDDIEGNSVHITKAIKHFENGFMELKTDSSERTIPVDSRTMELIQPLIDHANPFVFGETRSLPIASVQRFFDKAIKNSGVKKIRIHDLRHSHATWLINNNVNVVAVSKRLGHSSINQTLKTYTHLLESTNDEMMNKIEQFRATNCATNF